MEFDKTYLSKHIKRCIIKYNNFTNNTEGASRSITNDNENHDIENHNDMILNNDNININNDHNIKRFNRTLLVGPSFCGKTQLLKNQLHLIRLYDNEKQIHIITRSPEQYQDLEIEDIVIEEDIEDKSISKARSVQDYQFCCVVFDDMLDSNQKLIDPFFTRGRHNDLDVYYSSQSYNYLKEQLETIRIF